MFWPCCKSFSELKLQAVQHNLVMSSQMAADSHCPFHTTAAALLWGAETIACPRCTGCSAICFLSRTAVVQQEAPSLHEVVEGQHGTASNEVTLQANSKGIGGISDRLMPPEYALMGHDTKRTQHHLSKPGIQRLRRDTYWYKRNTLPFHLLRYCPRSIPVFALRCPQQTIPPGALHTCHPRA